MSGEGKYIWGDGRIYIGSYKNDKKHGFGKYMWADGRKYIGFWENGKQNGYGKYISKNEYGDFIMQIGFWNKGKRIYWLNESDITSLKNDENFKKIFAEN
jgi:hypothetical protein